MGSVYLVIANPKAIKENTREINHNLNRCFLEDLSLINKYEKSLVEKIKPILDESEFLLDLHTFSDKNGLPFLIGHKNGSDIAKELPFEYMVTGLDKIEDGSTDGYMNKKSKIGFCAELSSHEDTAGYKKGIDVVNKFLELTGNKNNKKATKQEKTKILLAEGSYKRKNEDFSFAQKINNFYKAKKGEVICIDGKEKISFSEDKILILPNEKAKIGTEVFFFCKII